jgi:predicted site-specific integrase-resolvase
MSQKKPDPDDLLGPSAASHVIKVSTMTVRRLARDGLLTPVTIEGIGIAFRRSEVEKVAAERRKGPKASKAKDE